MGLEGIRLPLGPPVTINGLDLCTPTTTPPPPDLLHVAPTSHLPDEVDDVGAHALTPPPGTMA
jgi:hypothetical protein